MKKTILSLSALSIFSLVASAQANTVRSYNLTSVEQGVCVKEIRIRENSGWENAQSYSITHFTAADPVLTREVTHFIVPESYGDLKFKKTETGFTRQYKESPAWSYFFSDHSFFMKTVRRSELNRSTWDFSDDNSLLTLTVKVRNIRHQAIPQEQELSVCHYSLGKVDVESGETSFAWGTDTSVFR